MTEKGTVGDHGYKGILIFEVLENVSEVWPGEWFSSREGDSLERNCIFDGFVEKTIIFVVKELFFISVHVFFVTEGALIVAVLSQNESQISVAADDWICNFVFCFHWCWGEECFHITSKIRNKNPCEDVGNFYFPEKEKN